MYTFRCTVSEAGDTRARNLRKFWSKFLHLCVDEQYLKNMMSTFRLLIIETCTKTCASFLSACHQF